MSFLTATLVQGPTATKSPRVFAPAEARVRKDAMPWDAELIASCDQHAHAADAPAHPAVPTHPAEGR